MRAAEHDGQIVISLHPDELRRITVALNESLYSLSRPEFFIRTGCSKPNMEAVAQRLFDLADHKVEEVEIDVTAGVEAEENPRRPRR
ncbi:hypothetical protein OG749_15290 [Streptomyces nojiriensis]|uniref:hypothetical protein n=1 Tax=Streptomyces nojiriensis TaxID=66374 RepID=UPI002E1843D6